MQKVKPNKVSVDSYKKDSSLVSIPDIENIDHNLGNTNQLSGYREDSFLLSSIVLEPSKPQPEIYASSTLPECSNSNHLEEVKNSNMFSFKFNTLPAILRNSHIFSSFEDDSPCCVCNEL